MANISRSSLALALLLSLHGTVAFAGGRITSQPQLYSQNFQLPSRGAPGNREGGASRGCVTDKKPEDKDKRLTALIPITNLGLTVAERPTFFWYVPPMPDRKVEFVLMDKNYNEIDRTVFQTKGKSGIVSYRLPAKVAPLQVGKDYRWYFSVICNPTSRSGDLVVEGWVQRVAPNPNLAKQLAKAPPSDRPNLYAQAGLWQDSLASLAELRRARPNDPATLNRWETLLKTVSLDYLAKEPLL